MCLKFVKYAVKCLGISKKKDRFRVFNTKILAIKERISTFAQEFLRLTINYLSL